MQLSQRLMNLKIGEIRLTGFRQPGPDLKEVSDHIDTTLKWYS